MTATPPRTPPGTPSEPPPGAVVGRPPGSSEKVLGDAATAILTKREENGRETATALIGQVAIVGTFLGGFSILGDAGKSAVIRSDSTPWALGLAALGLGLALTTFVALPSAVPDLDRLTELRGFLNQRALGRRLLLGASMIALIAAVCFALSAVNDARSALEPTGSGTIAGKISVPKEGGPSVEISTAWKDLERGKAVVSCVTEEGANTVLAAATATADATGAVTQELTLPVPTKATRLLLATSKLEDDLKDKVGPDACQQLLDGSVTLPSSVALVVAAPAT